MFSLLFNNTFYILSQFLIKLNEKSALACFVYHRIRLWCAANRLKEYIQLGPSWFRSPNKQNQNEKEQIFSYQSVLIFVLVAQKNPLIETVLLSTQKHNYVLTAR